MTLVKFNPDRELGNINKRLRKFFEDFDAPFFSDMNSKNNYSNYAFIPKVDVTEDNDNLYVKAELPGVDKKDVKVTVTGDVLTISGEKKTEQRDENKNYYRIERNSGAFSRSFTLPAEIMMDKIAAESKDGILTITLPKKEEAKIIEKQIDIQ